MKFCPIQQGSLNNLALIGHVVSDEMIEKNGHVHVHGPKAGADNSLGSFCFKHITNKFFIN